MRWLVTGVGAIGGILGARLAEAGEEVSFLVRRPEVRVALRDRGLTLISRETGVRRRYPVKVVAPQDPIEPFDLVLVTLRRDSIDEGFAESIAQAVGPQTLVVPTITCFELPPVLLDRFDRNCRVVGFPTGIGGWKGASDAELVVMMSRWGMHLILGARAPGARPDVGRVASAFRRGGVRVRVVRDPLSYGRVSAIFLVALFEGIGEDPRPSPAALRDAAVANRILGKLRSTARALHGSGCRLPLWARLPFNTPRPVGRLGLRYLARGAVGEGLDRFLATGGRAEAQALVHDLQAMGLR